jgi:hypothetical protein
MTDSTGEGVLVAAGFIQELDGGRPGDLAGLLEVANVERLAEALAERLPSGTQGLVSGFDGTDVLIAHTISRLRNLPRVLIYDVEGRAEALGHLPAGSHACMVAGSFSSPWVLDEFEGICRTWSVVALGAVVAVDLLAQPDPRVRSILRPSW